MNELKQVLESYCFQPLAGAILMRKGVHKNRTPFFFLFFGESTSGKMGGVLFSLYVL